MSYQLKSYNPITTQKEFMEWLYLSLTLKDNIRIHKNGGHKMSLFGK